MKRSWKNKILQKFDEFIIKVNVKPSWIYSPEESYNIQRFYVDFHNKYIKFWSTLFFQLFFIYIYIYIYIYVTGDSSMNENENDNNIRINIIYFKPSPISFNNTVKKKQVGWIFIILIDKRFFKKKVLIRIFH